jgi:hypothetical protein
VETFPKFDLKLLRESLHGVVWDVLSIFGKDVCD